MPDTLTRPLTDLRGDLTETEQAQLLLLQEKAESRRQEREAREEAQRKVQQRQSEREAAADAAEMAVSLSAWRTLDKSPDADARGARILRSGVLPWLFDLFPPGSIRVIVHTEPLPEYRRNV